MINAIQRKWWILVVVTLVAFITNVDATIVIVGLPRLMLGLHITITTGLWTLTAYIITSTVFLLPAGRWSDVVGRKRIFMIGLSIFTVATVLCGFAPSGALLITFRFIQGVGAALALATATPIIVHAFPKHQLGRALGINSTAWVIGSIVGPVAGGVLVTTLGWRWIFFVTVPFALAGMVAAWFVLEESAAKKSLGTTDWPGIASFGMALVLLLIGLSEGQAWGFGSLRILSLFAGTAVLLIGFVVRELRTVDPLFDLKLLLNRHYRAGLGVTVSYSIGYFATTFLLTIYLQGALHLSPLKAGLLLIPLSLPQLVISPLGGWLADRFGPPRFIILGVILLAVGGYLLGQLGPTLQLSAVIVPLLLMSVATGLAWPALTKVVMSSAPLTRTGAASGMFFTFRNVGMSLSLTLALVVAETSLPSAIAAKAFLGTAGVLLPHFRDILTHSTDAGFRVFVIFYGVALLFSLFLLRPIVPASTAVPQKEQA